MKTNSKLVRSLTGVVAMSVLAVMAYGSASPPTRVYTTSYSPVAIQYGTLVNENLRIESSGNSWSSSWSVDGGEDFQTPFSVYWWDGKQPRGLNSKTLIESYETAYRAGARPIRVHVDGVDEPLYGLIVFNSAIGAAYGPAKQSYYVKIPDQKIRQAMNGVTAVAFEKMKWKSSWTYNGAYNSSEKWWYSWILWLSRTPLVDEGPQSLREVN